MEKPLNEEFKRMQALAGINEIKIRKPSRNPVDFLNQHKEEAFEKMFAGIYGDDGENINIDKMSDWKEHYNERLDYTYIEADFPQASVAVVASLEPFPPEVEDEFDEEVEMRNIAGETIYYYISDY